MSKFWSIFDRIILAAGALSGVVAAYYARVGYLDSHPQIAAAAQAVPVSPYSYALMFGAGSVGMIAVGLVGLVKHRPPIVPVPVVRFGADEKQSGQQPNQTVVQVTPSYIIHLFDGHTDIQGDKLVEAFIGHRMSVTVTVYNVSSSILPNRTDVSSGDDQKTSILLEFSPDWKSRAETLIKNQKITVTGKLRRATRYWIKLEDCEFC